eukprot:snap_masked-scaffold_5-processed-gene-16.39-mRNA-1 protein AED:1.00 eAED:1.00 QI:0/0/0/0/1/1/2/0/63
MLSKYPRRYPDHSVKNDGILPNETFNNENILLNKVIKPSKNIRSSFLLARCIGAWIAERLINQ